MRTSGRTFLGSSFESMVFPSPASYRDAPPAPAIQLRPRAAKSRRGAEIDVPGVSQSHAINLQRALARHPAIPDVLADACGIAGVGGTVAAAATADGHDCFTAREADRRCRIEPLQDFARPPAE